MHIIDEYGRIQAQQKQLAERLAVLRTQILELGSGEHQGDVFKAKITEASRTNINRIGVLDWLIDNVPLVKFLYDYILPEFASTTEYSVVTVKVKSIVAKKIHLRAVA